MPEAIPGAMDAAMNKTDKSLCPSLPAAIWHPDSTPTPTLDQMKVSFPTPNSDSIMHHTFLYPSLHCLVEKSHFKTSKILDYKFFEGKNLTSYCTEEHNDTLLENNWVVMIPSYVEGRPLSKHIHVYFILDNNLVSPRNRWYWKKIAWLRSVNKISRGGHT